MTTADCFGNATPWKIVVRSFCDKVLKNQTLQQKPKCLFGVISLVQRLKKRTLSRHGTKFLHSPQHTAARCKMLGQRTLSSWNTVNEQDHVGLWEL